MLHTSLSAFDDFAGRPQGFRSGFSYKKYRYQVNPSRRRDLLRSKVDTIAVGSNESSSGL